MSQTEVVGHFRSCGIDQTDLSVNRVEAYPGFSGFNAQRTGRCPESCRVICDLIVFVSFQVV